MSAVSGMSWVLGLGGAAMAGLVGYANLPVSWLLPLHASATTQHLAAAQLKPLLGSSRDIIISTLFYWDAPSTTSDAPAVTSTSELWSGSGAVVMAVRRPG